MFNLSPTATGVILVVAVVFTAVVITSLIDAVTDVRKARWEAIMNTLKRLDVTCPSCGLSLGSIPVANGESVKASRINALLEGHDCDLRLDSLS